MKDFVITRKKKTHKRKERLLKRSRGCEKKKYLAIMVEGVGERGREGRKKRIGGIGRMRREWWGYLVPMLPVLDCLLDLVPYTCYTWPTAKILCAVLKSSMKSSSLQFNLFLFFFTESRLFLFRFSRVFPI
jgi:hypothetical protein